MEMERRRVIIFSDNLSVGLVNSPTAIICGGVMGNDHSCQIE